MNVVDPSGWLEYLANGPNAHHFAGPVEQVEDLIVPTISIYEVFKRMSRERGSTAAYEAAGHRELPMADSVILATATFYGAILWTQDSDFSAIDGVKYIPKSKSPLA